MTAQPSKVEKVVPGLEKQKAGSDVVEQSPLHKQAQNDVANNPKEVKQVLQSADGKTDVFKVTNENGEKVNAVQVMYPDGPRLKTADGNEYTIQKESSGKQVWVSLDGKSSVTQERFDDRFSRNIEKGTSGGGTDTTTGKTGGGATGGDGGNSGSDIKTQPASTDIKKDSDIKIQPISDDGSGKKIGGDGGGNQGGNEGGGRKIGGDGGGNQGGNEGGGKKIGGDGGSSGGDLKTQPVSTDNKKDSDIKIQPIGEEGGGKKGGGESGGEDGRGRKGGGESSEGGGKKGGGDGGEKGSGKSEERGENKPSTPEKPAEKPPEKGADKSPEKPAESGSEKSPLEKIDLSTKEGRKELFEALKTARDILDGKGDLKSVDPKQRALVEELMKLDQNRANKLMALLSPEFQGKGTPMSDAAYAFNLRTLLGLEKLANPTQPAVPIPGLTPELAKGLYDLFKMYTGEQNAQRSTLLGEAYKFSVDYNTKMGLDKNGLTSRDVLVALNTMSKEFGDLVTKQNPTPAAMVGTKETQAQLLGKDPREAASQLAEQAKQREMGSATAADQHAAAQARAMEAIVKAPQAPLAQDALAAGKVEGQIVKDAVARLDALAAQQHAAEQSVTAKIQPNQFGQKDPLTAEQKELADRDLGTKKRLEDEKDRERDEIARRMAVEAALAAAGGARATSAEITEGKDDDKDEKKQDEKEARRQYKTKQGDTLEMIAETQLRSKTAATLIYNINKDRIPAKVMGNLHIISMKSDLALELPTPNEVKTFKGPYMQFQYREFGSAEEELAFWQKFISGQEPGHSSLFDKFGFGQGASSPPGVGVDDSFAAEAFTAAQRQSIRTQLGMENKETANQTTKTVRYGESIRKFATRTLFDEALWELIARKNNLPVVDDNKGEKTVRLKSYQKLILPTAAEIKEYKQAKTGFATQQTFEMVSQECPKCRRLVRQNESVCPPPCFYAFVDGAADAKPADSSAEVKDDKAAGMLRRRRTTGFVPQSESKPDEVPDKPFENEVISTVLKAAGLSSAAKVEAPQITSKMPIPASSGMASNPVKRGIKVHEFDAACRVVLTPKDREGNKFERKLEVRKDDAWVPCVVYEIGLQESFVTEYDPTGAPRKQRIDLPFEPAMELSENHINEAWKEYRQQFLGE